MRITIITEEQTMYITQQEFIKALTESNNNPLNNTDFSGVFMHEDRTETYYQVDTNFEYVCKHKLNDGTTYYTGTL